MAKKGRPNVKQLFAANVKALIKQRDKSDEKKAAARLKMRPFELRRILSGDHYPRLDTVQRFADAYDIEPYQLLVLNLDAENPQVLRFVSPEEEKLYKVLEEAVAKRHPPGTQ
jgi:transcriptional regulator with XRE-family HTH domain